MNSVALGSHSCAGLDRFSSRPSSGSLHVEQLTSDLYELTFVALETRYTASQDGQL